MRAPLFERQKCPKKGAKMSKEPERDGSTSIADPKLESANRRAAWVLIGGLGGILLLLVVVQLLRGM
jgi:hypothetical protein